MKTFYRNMKNITGMTMYHVVFCPRFRRKIFTIPALSERFHQLVTEAQVENELEVFQIRCEQDTVYLQLFIDPHRSIQDAVKHIKSITSTALRREFKELSQMPYLWTRNFFVSTEPEISNETICWYVSQQKTRS